MKESIVAGADFSGAKTVPNDTWLAVAHVGELGVELADVRKVGSHALAQEISKIQGLTAVGLDFPFSVPADFIRFLAMKRLRKDYQSWQELAQELVFITQDEFLALVKEFKKEPKRFADSQTPIPAQSPLHRGNPSMVQMTYAGMRMLAMLDPAKFVVLPFDQPKGFAARVLEVYPRATLRALNLPDTNYKSQDKAEHERVREVRRHILKGLVTLRDRKGISYRDFPRLSVAKKFEHALIESDHALDAMIAAYTTATYMVSPQLFDDPFAAENLDVLTEGWIFYPKAPVS